MNNLKYFQIKAYCYLLLFLTLFSLRNQAIQQQYQHTMHRAAFLNTLRKSVSLKYSKLRTFDGSTSHFKWAVNIPSTFVLGAKSFNEDSGKKGLKEEAQSLTIPQLKDLLRQQGLPLSGNKADLIERLNSTPEPLPSSGAQVVGKADSKSFRMSDFEVNEDYVYNEKIAQAAFQDVLGISPSKTSEIEDDMDSRIREALMLEEGDYSDDDETEADSELFNKEWKEQGEAPFEETKDASTPIRRKVRDGPKALIVETPMACSGCGASFQCHEQHSAGYIPPEKFEIVMKKLLEKEQAEQQKLEELQSDPPLQTVEMKDENIAITSEDMPASDTLTEEDETENIQDEQQEEERVVCMRCYKLMFYGQIEDSLRPGWSNSEFLTPKRFQDLLSVIRTKKCVVVYLTDMFDFSGSLLWNLNKIVGDNPVLLAVNKIDILPDDMSKPRALTWIHSECKRLGLNIPRKHISLISCRTGNGVERVIRDMRFFAKEMKGDIYVIGAANVGKSTFINYLLEGKGAFRKKGKKSNIVTTSPIPGTTLDFVKIDIGGTLLIDTPGLILPHQLTIALDPRELKAVLPTQKVEHVTLRLAAGKSVLIGGLARLDVIEGLPFFFTFFASNQIKLHATTIENGPEFVRKHVGKIISPPYSEERFDTLCTNMVTHEFIIEGKGWQYSAKDLHISGLGFISVTGSGKCKVQVSAPSNVMVVMRDALLPYDSRDSMAKFTGGRTIKKGIKKGGRRI